MLCVSFLHSNGPRGDRSRSAENPLPGLLGRSTVGVVGFQSGLILAFKMNTRGTFRVTAGERHKACAKSLRAGLLAVLAFLATALSNPVVACSFHTYKPVRTLVDKILESETLVLARQSQNNAHRFKIANVLQGTAHSEPIPFLVDTATRRRLATNADHGVLLSLDGQGNWRYLSYVDQNWQDLVKIVMRQAPMWRDQIHHPDRFAALSLYLNHKDPRLHYLALQEIDRVPYETLRTLRVPVSAETLLEALGSWRDAQYEPINMLLLGLTDAPEAGPFLRQQVGRLHQSSTPGSLGAAATALIEVDGEDGIKHLSRLLLSDKDQPMAKVAAVVEAMAIHSNLGSDHLQRTIEETLIGFVRNRPAGAATVARQFSLQRNWSIGPHLEAMMDDALHMTPAARLQVAIYVAQSKAGSR